MLGFWLLSMLVLVAPRAADRQASPSPVLQALEQELTRSMSVLKEQPRPPYYLSYEIADIEAVRVTSSFGTIISSDETHERRLDIDLRVGSYKLDNSHPIRGDMFGGFADRYSQIQMPIEDDPDAIRGVLWYHTDQKYKRALENYTKVLTNVKVKVEEEDQSADFSREEPVKYVEAPGELALDREAWERKLAAYTKPFAEHGNIYQAEANLVANRINRWFVNSEGSRIQNSRVAYRVFISALTKAEDGMELPRYQSFFAYRPEDLPDDAAVLAEVRTMIDDLQALRTAPLVEPYAGPAILSGRASGVFFHEIFGHRVEGHRQRSEDDAQTFGKMVNRSVLPETFSVVFDPTVRHLAGTDLAGHYRVDNEGVKARRVTVVENGILKSFLLSRRPIDGFSSSNGHGRRQPGFAPVSRQSNLIVEASETVSPAELKQELIDRVKEEGKPFGLLFDDVRGGFTFTGRTIPNAFNVTPVMVYRVFPDGREELVRGVDLIGTPLTAFSKIVSADDRPAVFNGTCGAESGGVPVSAVSPAILVSQIEVQKKEKSHERPPLLSPPFPQASAK
jgi:predicted Zn-dependent protease